MDGKWYSWAHGKDYTMMGYSSVSVSMTKQAGTMTWATTISPRTPAWIVPDRDRLWASFLTVQPQSGAMFAAMTCDVSVDATKKHPQSVFLKLDVCISNRIFKVQYLIKLKFLCNTKPYPNLGWCLLWLPSIPCMEWVGGDGFRSFRPPAIIITYFPRIRSW